MPKTVTLSMTTIDVQYPSTQSLSGYRYSLQALAAAGPDGTPVGAPVSVDTPELAVDFNSVPAGFYAATVRALDAKSEPFGLQERAYFRVTDDVANVTLKMPGGLNVTMT